MNFSNFITRPFSQQLNDYRFIKLINKTKYTQIFLIETKYGKKKQYLMSKISLIIFSDPLIINHLKMSFNKWFSLSQIKDSNLYIIKYLSHFFSYDSLYVIFEYRNTVVFDDFYNDLINTKQVNYGLQKKICYHLIKGLHFMHSNQISHNNIQPQSIWYSMTEFKPYWVDFGFQIPTNTHYFSPELSTAMLNQSHNRP